MGRADRRPRATPAHLGSALLAGLALAGLLAFSTAGAAGAFEPPASLRKASFELVTDRTAYEPGSTARIAAWVTVEPGWHVNSNPPSDENLIPVELTIGAPDGWPAARVTYPPGELQQFSFADLPLSVYDGEFRIFATLAIPEGAALGSQTLETSLLYQACDDSTCLAPVTARQPLTLTIGPGGKPAHLSSFEAAPASGGGRAASSGGGGRSLWTILFLGMVGGLILNAMPCVLPVLSLKVFGLVKSAGVGRRSVVVGALATTAGILASFWALALAAILAKSAGSAVGWGIQFQNPLFVAGLTVVIVLFCLNLWGLFEITLPQALSRVGSSGRREGLAGHFGSGLFATLMATPCSAPFLGVAVGFALAQSWPVILAVFTAVGLGMALPYLALALFPRAAGWLPKPGAWMDLFKGVMGFLLAAAAVWLLFVLSAQLSAARLAFFQLALLILALCVWLRHRARGTIARRVALVAVLATIAATLWLAHGATAPQRSASEAKRLIEWVDFDRAQAEALARDGEIVFVDVTADWCFTCKVNERLILETEEVAGAFQRHGVIAMKADWTTRNQAIGDYLESFGRAGIPFYVLYTAGAKPQVFSELPSKSGIVAAVETAAGGERLAAADDKR